MDSPASPSPSQPATGRTVTSTVTSTATTSTAGTRARSTILSRQAADAWPRHPRDRWLLRLAYALPFVVVAFWTRGSAWRADSDLALARRGDLVRWGDTDLGWMAEVYPPLSAGLASLLRGDQLAFTLVAALVVGFSLQRLTGVLVRGGFGAWPTAAVMGTLVLTPPLHYLATNALEQILGLALLVLALDGIASFVEKGSTEAGFTAGLALGLAVMVEPSAWIYALTLAAVAPFIARRTGPRRSHVQLATVAVLLFPALAAMGFWFYLSWWFTDDPVAGISSAVLGTGTPSYSAADAVVVVGQGVLASPLFLVAFGVRLFSNRWSLVAPGIAVAGLVVSLWLGLREAAGQTYLVVTVLYILLLAARRPSRAREVVIVVAALVQTALVWVLSLTTPSVLGDWIRVVVGG